MSPYLSILICSHNPREPSLRRTLEGLARQSLPRDRWELLLIDNHSATSLRDRYDLSWHPHGRHLTAETLGKTHAIARGVQEASGEVLVIVDDDNVLHEDYLEVAEKIFQDYPFMGAAGGIIKGEFGVPPPDWAVPHLFCLAIVDRGNEPCYACTPDYILVCPGAGMVIRKRVVQHYLAAVATDPVRQSLDPVGERLSRNGDIDMMLCAYEVGLAKGYFPALRLTHLIPAERLRLSYLAALRYEGMYSEALLRLSRGGLLPSARAAFLRNCLRILWESLRARKMFWQRWRLEWAVLRGQQNGMKAYAALVAEKKDGTPNLSVPAVVNQTASKFDC